ncbi:MAG: hypothetical protein QGI41_03355, partial [Acidimicrobiales bacterium]|nr:hypothetical protein [Acidimicrobiales bacterium]
QVLPGVEMVTTSVLNLFRRCMTWVTDSRGITTLSSWHRRFVQKFGGSFSWIIRTSELDVISRFPFWPLSLIVYIAVTSFAWRCGRPPPLAAT